MTLPRYKVIAVFMIILGVLTSCGSSFDGSVTVYPTMNAISGERVTLWRTVYKASFEAQTVVYWYPWWRETPEKLINCTVRDKNNWVGEYADHSGKVEMVDGRIVTDTPGRIYGSSFYWWSLKFKERLWMTFSL